MLNVVLPLAGEGSRFAKAGYQNPKPFIEFSGRFMALHVVDNVALPGARYVFLCQRSHLEKFGAEFVRQLRTRSFVKDFEIVPVDGTTEGAACTVLLAKNWIDTTDELLLVNGDQLIDDDFGRALRFLQRNQADAGVWCFFNQAVKWSYVTVDSTRRITRVAEKQVISDHATCGAYYVRQGAFFVEAAERMIVKNDRVNGEFYVAPAFNYLIADDRRVLPWWVNEMHGLGTPEDLQAYLSRG